MSTHVCYLCEMAVAEYLRGKDLGVGAIYEGIFRRDISSDEHEIKEYPCVITACQSAQMNPEQSGNWRAMVNVSVYSNADDTSAVGHHQLVTAVYDSLLTDTIAKDLSALDGFTAFLVLPQEQGWDIQERSWVSSLSLQIECAGKNIE
jgi:hypothetical protein